MEYRRKCNVCGKIYCYSDQDLKNNKTNSVISAVSALGSIASVIGGTNIEAYALGTQADRYEDKVIDYNKCPSCHSSDTTLLSDSDSEALQNTGSTTNSSKTNNIKCLNINNNASEESLLKRTLLFIEDRDWESATAYCEQILDLNPECALAYVYKLMIDYKVTLLRLLVDVNDDLATNKNYQKAIRFADVELKHELEEYNYKNIDRKNETAYKEAINLKNLAKSESEYLEAKTRFDLLGDYLDSKDLSNICRIKADESRNKGIYDSAITLLNSNSITALENAITEFEKIASWKDAKTKLDEAKKRLDQLQADEKKKEKRKKTKSIFIKVLVVIGVIVAFIIGKKIKEQYKYNAGIECFKKGLYEDAKEYFKNSKGPDVDLYYEYCIVYQKIKNSNAQDVCTNLTELYQKIDQVSNIGPKDDLISESEGLKQLYELEGTKWYDTKGMYDETATLEIKNGEFILRYKYNGEEEHHKNVYVYNSFLYDQYVSSNSSSSTFNVARIHIYFNREIEMGIFDFIKN